MQVQQFRLQSELDERNRPLTDEDLDDLLPSDGFEILIPPESYKPIRTPSRKVRFNSICLSCPP